MYAKWGGFTKIFLPNASRTGYTFANWWTTAASGGTDKGGSGAQYQPTGATTLYARWTANKYYVTFDPVGGTVVGTSPKQVAYGSAYGTLPSANHEEYSFNGWFTRSEGGTQVTSSTTVNTAGNHTLYAHWNTGMITVTFDPDGGFLPDGVSETKRCRIGEPIGELPTPTRSGYSFGFWYEEDDPETSVDADRIAPDHDMVLIAGWIPNFYMIHFNANGGNGEMSDQIVQWGARERLKANQFTHSGGSFIGWSSSPTGNVEWEDTDEVFNLAKNIGEVVNLYAVWYSEPITVRFNSNWDQYTMTFNANGGVGGWSKRLDSGT